MKGRRTVVLSDTDVRTRPTMDEAKERVVHTAWLTARAPEELVARVKDHAEAEDRSESSVVRIAVREYLERNEKGAA